MNFINDYYIFINIIHNLKANILIYVINNNVFSLCFLNSDMSWLKSPEDFFFRLEQDQQTKCTKLVRMGGGRCKE